MKNRCVEAMTRCNVGPCAVRVWTDQGSTEAPLIELVGPDQNVLRRLKEVDDTWQTDAELDIGDVMELIRNALESLSNVAAYEILSAQQHGVVVYPDWK
jgi:hypothetical protein